MRSALAVTLAVLAFTFLTFAQDDSPTFKAKAAGATVLVDPYTADRRQAAIISFPGGYIAEIHSAASPQAH